MATLSQIVDVIAAVEGIDPERVGAIARAVREAGLIATGGRGPSAAQMTEKDAANLLIAVNAADTARNAPEIVARYRTLEAKKKKRTVEFGHQFEQAILAARVGNISEYVRGLVHDFGSTRNPHLKRAYPQSAYVIHIQFEKPDPFVSIQVSIPLLAMDQISFRRGQLTRDQRSQNDRKERITITHRTLIAVGQALQEA